MKTTIGMLAAVAAIEALAIDCERIFRPAQLTRDNVNIEHVQPIDDAAWLWDGTKDDAEKVLVFRRVFEVAESDGPLTFDVSADERFYLTLDGEFVARGPNRGSVENWQYQTYRTSLKPGRHEFRAVVTRLGNGAPIAQLSNGGGFVMKAEGAYDAKLTTGIAKWQVAEFTDMRDIGKSNGVWGTGSQFEITGSGPFAVNPTSWREAAVTRAAAAPVGTWHGGSRTAGWMLFPSQIPDQIERHVRPGRFVAATHEAGWRKEHVYTQADTKAAEVTEFNRLLDNDKAVVKIPAKTRVQLVWDLGDYYCAYPRITLSGGKGARVSWTWAESMRDAATRRKLNRAALVGKYLDGFGDVFVSDGRPNGEFSSPWFRCGVWCRIDIETGDAPLEISGLEIVESRYPMEMESVFETNDDPSMASVRRICTRAMQMCDHEMLFDCPYYEQQMYPGDTRVQLLVLSALSRDDRMIRRVMDIYDLATRDDGMCPFNYPSRRHQEGLSYTLCYLCMFGDYVMNHGNREWLRARIPGLRKSMAGCEYYENAEGLLENTPGWNFMDWARGWHRKGIIDNSNMGRDVNAFINLFWLLAMQSAATTERAMGNELQAQYWEQKEAKLKERIVAKFWDPGRGLLADTAKRQSYSEHVQALAIIADALPADKRNACFGHLVSDPDLIRTTVYFSYYLFEAYFKMGRADLFRKRIDLWRGYLDIGVRALLEAPDDVGKNGQKESRSDCHAWGAHPVWFMQTWLAGIHSDAPFFEKVLVAPQPGGIKSFRVRHPHPKGWIEADLSFADGKASGKVVTPVEGVFAFGDQTIQLKVGENEIGGK